MRESPIELQLLVSFLVFLFPLALYCLFLAYINRGRNPFVISGVWDSIGLAIALSGFLLYTLPRTILWPISVRVMEAMPGGDDPLLASSRALVLGITYYVLLMCTMAVLLLLRRHKTIIYNVETDVVRARLARVLAELGLDCVYQSGRLLIAPIEAFSVAPPPEPDAFSSTPISLAQPQAPAKTLTAMPGGPRYAEVTLEPFRPLCNVTLRWDNYPAHLRREIEQRLAITLEGATAADNPAAGWFLGFSGLVFGTITMLAGMFIVLLLWRR